MLGWVIPKCIALKPRFLLFGTYTSRNSINVQMQSARHTLCLQKDCRAGAVSQTLATPFVAGCQECFALI